jgi:hypothetical protein
MENQSQQSNINPADYIAPSLRIKDLLGLIPTISSAPTYIPKRFADQFRIYANGVTYRLYIYDVSNATWRYVALT